MEDEKLQICVRKRAQKVDFVKLVTVSDFYTY